MRKFAVIFILSLFIVYPCFAENNELQTSWTFYKSVFINNDGRVIDYEKKSITTSEGQSYALLRAVMINDKPTFEKVYKWTKNNLKRDNDNLFAWLWGEKDSNYGQIDDNSATDSDIDIAFALIIASRKWGDSYYLKEAKKIITDIWKHETVLINNKRILTAGYNQAQKEVIDVNPSYFAPYAFRLFAMYDNNDWNKLINDNYELLEKVINSTQSKLPPDWLTIHKSNGEFYLDKDSTKSDFSYDAVRLFIRIYLDYLFTKDIRAKKIIENAQSITEQTKDSGKLFTNIKENAEMRNSDQPLASIGILLPVINYLDPILGKTIYDNKINNKYNKFGYWENPYDYYGQNLVWFGAWIYLNENRYKKFNLGK